MIDNEALFIYDTKNKANAKKFSFVWHKATNRYKVALDKQSIKKIAHHFETELMATEEQLPNEKEKENQS